MAVTSSSRASLSARRHRSLFSYCRLTGGDGGGGGGYVRRVRRRGGVFQARRTARHRHAHACAANARAYLERAARGRARVPSLGRAGSVSGVNDERARARRRRRRRRRCAVVVFTRTGVAGPYTHESRHLLISNASHMYNERNRLTRQVSRAPLAPRAPRHRRVLSSSHERVVLVESTPVRLGSLHEFLHRMVPLELVCFRGPEQHV